MSFNSSSCLSFPEIERDRFFLERMGSSERGRMRRGEKRGYKKKEGGGRGEPVKRRNFKPLTSFQ